MVMPVVQKVALRGSKPGLKKKTEIQDDSIMGTNNSSIVSKRSVERLYFPDEPHYFRYFVKKPQRRSPLINRGYWLRMQAIDHVVRHFLETPSNKQKVIINLGCGYDPLPWQCLARYPSACHGVKFIDIDYRDLMVRKRDMVQSTSELHEMLTSVEVREEGSILLTSDQYLQLGCDLRDLDGLSQGLASAVDVDDCTVLFTAEVSITYMNAEAANSLVQWAGRLTEAQFCLLEQLMPDGADHPFARTMMAHFKKLQTPLGAVKKYPTTTAQRQRFEDLGWSNISARNLWELWSSPDFLSPGDRSALDNIEPFDEWEEFALFGCHYVLLTADNKPGFPQTKTPESSYPMSQPLYAETLYSENPSAHGCRRFGAGFPMRSTAATGDTIGNFGGMGLNTRLGSYDVYSTSETNSHSFNFPSSSTPSSRMCHTITDLGDAGAFLVGGRTSPDNALADCWIYHKWPQVWERVEDLPQPRYRHSAVSIGNDSVLVSPGRSDSRKVESAFLIWTRQFGWRKCAWGMGDKPHTTYGSTFTAFTKLDNLQESISGCGLIAGGMSEDGVVQEEIWEWELQHSSFGQEEPTISFTRLTKVQEPNMFAAVARFGAATVNHNGQTFVLGGIIKNKVLTSENEISTFISRKCHAETICPATLQRTASIPRSLLIGVSVLSVKDSLIIMGGSAVCFSFGTFWNKGCFIISLPPTPTNNAGDTITKPKSLWKYRATGAAMASTTSKSNRISQSTISCLAGVPRVKIQLSEEFSRIVEANKPVILEGSNLGSCSEVWTQAYLKEKVGSEREVVIHQATTEHMDFQAKNFSYVTKTFGEFIDQASNGEKLYLRSLSSNKPSELPADITRDFPSIAGDFRLPNELSLVMENVHSSPLRISGPVIMWLHYDVMANILCQIRASKRLLIFPPSDVQHFPFEAGASSSSVNVFDKLEEYVLAGAHPYEAQLSPGDILFLPPLWLHTAIPTSGMSVAVNMFFRNLQTGYAAGKDVYGNRDLQAYEKGRQDIAKIARSFDSLPADVRGFYLRRLVQELDQTL